MHDATLNINDNGLIAFVADHHTFKNAFWHNSNS
jgi:hypothetical protein